MVPNERVEQGLTIALSFIAIVGNVLVFSAMCARRTLRADKTRFFTVSLCVSGLVHAVLVMPLYSFRDSYKEMFSLGVHGCSAWFATDYMASTVCSWSMALVCWNRNKQNAAPVKHAIRMTTCRVLRLIAAVWFMSAAFYYPAFFLNWNTVLFREQDQKNLEREQNKGKESSLDFPCDVRYSRYFLMVTIFITWVVPCSILLCNYTGLYISIVDHTSDSSNIKASSSAHALQHSIPAQTPRHSTPTQTFQHSIPAQTLQHSRHPTLGSTFQKNKMITPSPRDGSTTLGMLVCLYMCMWLPGFGFYVKWVVDGEAQGLIFPVFMWLMFANSCLNTVTFPICDAPLCKAYKRILTCCCSRPKDEDYITEPLYPGHNTIYSSNQTGGHDAEIKGFAKKPPRYRRKPDFIEDISSISPDDIPLRAGESAV